MLWCVCHLTVAGVTLWSAQGSLAVTALSHLIMFDALGASVCVVVDVLSNFEVWKRSSVRHPFGYVPLLGLSLQFYPPPTDLPIYGVNF